MTLKKLKPISWDMLRQPDPRTQDIRIPSYRERAPSAGYTIESESYPCPDPECAHGTIYFSLPDGTPAIWDGGVLFVKRSQ